MRDNEQQALDALYNPFEWIDCSGACALARCPRRYLWQYRMGLVPRDDERLALVFGSAIHSGIPHMYEHDIDGAMDAFGRVWGDRDKFDDKARNTLRAKIMLLDFGSFHSGGEVWYEVMKAPVGKIEIEDSVGPHEVAFGITLDCGIPFIGRMDATGIDKSGNVWVVEYKTSSRLTSFFLEGLGECPQVLGYTLAGRMLYPDKKVVGCIIEGLQVAKVKVLTMAQGFEVEGWKVGEFVEWISRLAAEAKDKEDAMNEYGIMSWPKTPSACTAYPSYGMATYPCVYKALCWTVKEWENMVDMYEQEIWRPFTPLGEKEIVKEK